MDTNTTCGFFAIGRSNCAIQYTPIGDWSYTGNYSAFSLKKGKIGNSPQNLEYSDSSSYFFNPNQLPLDTYIHMIRVFFKIISTICLCFTSLDYYFFFKRGVTNRSFLESKVELSVLLFLKLDGALDYFAV